MSALEKLVSKRGLLKIAAAGAGLVVAGAVGLPTIAPNTAEAGEAKAAVQQGIRTQFPADGSYVEVQDALALSDSALIFLYDKNLPRSHQVLYQSIARFMRKGDTGKERQAAYAYPSNVEDGRMRIMAKRQFIGPVFSSEKLASVEGRSFLLQFGPKTYKEQFGDAKLAALEPTGTD